MPRRKSPSSDRYARSKTAHAAARKLMPGGVNSPVRAFNAVGGSPITITSASGCRLTDLDGNHYIDYVASYGPLIAGHAPDSVVAAITKAASHGSTFGMPTDLESQLAAAVIAAVPSIQLIRFVNSGTEAVMSALRLARAATHRDKIVKCIGAYHGHADSLLLAAGSGATTLATPSSPGIPHSFTQHTLLVHYNDLHAMRNLFDHHPNHIAAVCIEPIAGNMGCIPPTPGYLQALRDLCTTHRSLLLFDEVMTGFRVHYGGAQSLYNVTPDLTALGKIIGGGLPCAAYGGREDLMRQISPDGPVYQAGTLSGNPLAMAAGLATLELLRAPETYQQLESASAALAHGLTLAAKSARVPLTINRVGSMLTPFFTNNPVTNYTDATAADTTAYAAFFHAMLDQGITLPPSQFESWFISLAHDDDAIQQTITAAAKAFIRVAAGS